MTPVYGRSTEIVVLCFSILSLGTAVSWRTPLLFSTPTLHTLTLLYLEVKTRAAAALESIFEGQAHTASTSRLVFARACLDQYVTRLKRDDYAGLPRDTPRSFFTLSRGRGCRVGPPVALHLRPSCFTSPRRSRRIYRC